MNPLARKFYDAGAESYFQEVLFLCEDREVHWEELREKVPDLSRGWFELSRISSEERIEFVRDLWFDFLPYQPASHAVFVEFFSRLDDIAPVVVRKEDELHSEMVYSLADNSTFFRGLSPAGEEDLRELRAEMGLLLPRDYLSFLRIHNGFGKLSELGVLRIEDVGMARQRVRDMLLSGGHTVQSRGRAVDPGSLVPFYEAYGLSSFQCFYADWYPGSEMGNVYLSGIDYTISDTGERKSWAEGLGFATFLEWLAYYLDGMNLSP